MMISPPHGWRELLSVFGNPSYSDLSGGSVDMEDAWESECLVLRRRVCGLTNEHGMPINVRLHHLAVEPFEVALQAAILAAPAYRIRMLGGYCPRHMRHNPRMPLSIHAYGAAVDVNWDTNPMSTSGAMTTDLPTPFVDAFRTAGWEWGGDWRSVQDPMHFQYAHGV